MANVQPLIKPIWPQINWGVPITQGLIFDAPLAESVGLKAYDVVAHSQVQGAFNSGASWVKKLYGTAVNFDGSTGQIAYTTVPASVQGLTKFSVEILEYPGSILSNCFVLTKKSGTAAYFRLSHNEWNSGDFALLVGNGTTTGDWGWNMTYNAWYHHVVTYDSSSVANIPSLYRNGVFTAISNTRQPVGALPADDANLYLGSRSDTTFPFLGVLAYARIWNRVLTATEAKQLYENPWRIYRQPSIYSRLTAPVAAAPMANSYYRINQAVNRAATY